MRTVVALFAIAALSVGCRTTHEADEEELGELNSVDAGITSSSEASTDFGEASLAMLSGIQSPLRSLSDKNDNNDSLSFFLTEQERDLLREARFVSAGRDEWPDCFTETDNGVVYDNCGLGAGGAGASVNFLVDGFYEYDDDSSVADILFDFSVDAASIGAGVTFQWIHDLAWTDTTFDGEFELDWASGVAIGGLPPLGAVTFHVDATVENLTGDDTCEGPVAGLVDWRSRLREGNDPPETTHVTVEWLACGEALITR